MTPAAQGPLAPVYDTPPQPARVRRFSVSEYHRLIEGGFFKHDERFELLEGHITAKMSRNPPHDACIAKARRLLDDRLPAGWHVRVQSAVTTEDSEPEPDLAVVLGEEFDYLARHPGAVDTALVVEVANTTLADDRGVKLRIYARAGFGAYWIVNLLERTVEVYRDPTGPDASPRFREPQVYVIGQSVPFDGPLASLAPVPVADLFPSI